jgi:hypothetical protein
VCAGDEIELAIMTSRCWNELHLPLRAVPVLESALAVQRRPCPGREVEQAATIASSLEITGDVASTRPRQRLAVVAKRLSPHRDLSAVRDLLSGHALDPSGVRL